MTWKNTQSTNKGRERKVVQTKKQENKIIRVSVPNLFLDKNTSQYKLLIYKIL